ncbi:DUF2268 domain-containing putative Zn-dependent protease [Sporosarcina thermotolerans]|uniref:DUF2268 domain-containing putative Zn-dependent protease n=1 Tax=Sporosarcina thermotolerans TaxID=633404 RepID=A0AAW9A9M8_9BACL|nr:DUF2268 domain-containing putative Zn-dependent protease [Sporosarcina thermotolerans]MDW0115901.1 DUF2268 domain-containing putative Zn-dependent protease [Sporosarcina thermotolerans]WHT46880.1 DUF2268 domain-containing putative Zn-dependent protease [Sporosarcina thermotolerans]
MLYGYFFDAVKDNPDQTLYRLYQQEIIQPVYEACFKDAEHFNMDSATVLEWTPKESDFDSIKNQIEKMNKDYLNEIFEESLVKSSDILPSDKTTTVCVFPENERYPSQMVTSGSGKVTVFYSRLDNTYKPGMAHEYHHSVWIGKHHTENYNLTGLDYLILEGQAVMFETLVYPNLNSTHYYVDEGFNKENWSKIEPYLNSIPTNEIIAEMMFGGTNNLPHNYGYSEGYKMVRSYLNMHPDMTVGEWTSKSSEEIFEEGNYMANYLN